MSDELVFLNFDGLDDHQEKEILTHLSPFNSNPDVEFPWDSYMMKVNSYAKGDPSVLNVYAPSFQSVMMPPPPQCDQNAHIPIANTVYYANYPDSLYGSNSVPIPSLNAVSKDINGNADFIQMQTVNQNDLHSLNLSHPYEHPLSQNQIGSSTPATYRPGPTVSSFMQLGNLPYVAQASLRHTLVNGKVADDQKLLDAGGNRNSGIPPEVHSHVVAPVSSGDLSLSKNSSPEHNTTQSNRPLATSVPSSKAVNMVDNINMSQGVVRLTHDDSTHPHIEDVGQISSAPSSPNVASTATSSESIPVAQETSKLPNADEPLGENVQSQAKTAESKTKSPVVLPTAPPPIRSFADVLKSKADQRTSVTSAPIAKTVPVTQHGEQLPSNSFPLTDEKKLLIRDDKLAVSLGRHLHQLSLDFTPLCLQPRGLINRRNWCYVNATLQALLACSPFYTLLRNLPIGPAVDRGKSSTPVIDSMMNLAYEFTQAPEPQEDFQPGTPFQPLTIYEMLGNLKSDCLKGQQEDAEEFLSYILNGMHEEMVSIIKNYEEKYNLSKNDELKPNGHVDASDGEDEWQVIGVKQRGMVTRKVMEHRTPISDLLGGQIKSFLSTSGSKTSASVQPFFTLQLDIQSEHVTSVEEALSQMTAKEPIQGYTCAKTKQEVEAYSHVTLQKLPPILILHLKRFVYDKTGGCKKVMKHTEYPMSLELKKELFSPEARRMKRPSSYKLFAVMYHDGEEAVKGHYISDIYHHGSKTWLRCDDRTVTSITEAQVLSHSPPRVPYLLFYQASNKGHENAA